jgi:hypothetical protein
MDVRLHRLRVGFFWRDDGPGGRERWPGGGVGGLPRWALPFRPTGCLGWCGCWLRRRWGGRRPGPPGPRLGEPRGFRLRFSERLRRWFPAGGFRGLGGRPCVPLVEGFGGVFGFPVGPVLDRCGDPGDRLQERENELLDRILRRLGCSAPEQTPRQPPPEALAEQADQCGEHGERGGRRGTMYRNRRGLSRENNILPNVEMRCAGFGAPRRRAEAHRRSADSS